MFVGTYTALITPFRNGKIDAPVFKALIDRQAAAGITGIVPVGTTGESATLTTEEHIEVIRLAVEFNAGRMQVVAGTGANATQEAIELTQEAAKLGADGTLQVTPYYNKPSQEGLYQHFKAIANCSDLPIMLYSVPGRAVIEIAPETAARIAADCPTVVAIKEAGGRPERVDALRDALPKGFEILSGDDPLTYEFMKRGACGLVSVSANIVPEVLVSLVSAMNAGDEAKAKAVHDQFSPLFNGLMGLDVNPVPIKCAVAEQGHCTDEFRLPMVPLSAENREKMKALLRKFDLI